MGSEQQNNKLTAAINAVSGPELQAKYQDAMRMLFSACLRAPYDFSLVADRFSEKWFSDTPFFAAAEVMFKQHLSGHRFSVPSIAAASGYNQTELFAAAQESNGIDLALAFEMAEPEYKRYIEFKAAQESLSALNSGSEAEEARDRADVLRRESDIYKENQSAEEKADFDKWLNDKIQGKEEAFICRPHLSVLTNETKIIKGFRPGSLVIIGARPSMGKTQLALNLASFWSNQKIRGLFFSVEMNESDLMRRQIGIETGINPEADWSMLSESDKAKIWGAADRIKNSTCKVIGNVNTIQHLVSVARAEHYRQPLDYIILDYLQLLNGTQSRNGNREQEVAGMSRELKRLAKSLKVPVIALAQLSRAVESRGGDKRPQLSDLRESGGVEQDADIVIFPHRPEYYGIMEDENGYSMQGVAEMLIRKHRNGKVGAVRCRFDGVRGFYDEYQESAKFPSAEFATMPVNRTEDLPF